MHVADLVGDAAWCAGVHIVRDGRVLLTYRPVGTPGTVRWVGGGQEPGETFAACAVREAREEIGCDVELLHCTETLLERKPAIPERVRFDDRPAPLVVQRYDDGMWLVMYRAEPLSEPAPVDEPTLLWVPVDMLDHLVASVRPDQATELGIRIVGAMPEDALWIGENGAEWLLRRERVD